ncbi:hypothetical protein TNCV_420711 [Trichonephila clavipes]|nr:hypothetical protein TNCV_420711 [Trichonephila clavipes]
MSLQERKGMVDGYEWRCRSQSKDNPHDVRSVRKGTWFSERKLAITIILRLTRYWFGKSMNAFVVNADLTVTKNSVSFCALIRTYDTVDTLVDFTDNYLNNTSGRGSLVVKVSDRG